MDRNGHVCLGSCRALISEEEYANGLHVCGAEVCTQKGQSFVRGWKCGKCGLTYVDKQTHRCEMQHGK